MKKRFHFLFFLVLVLMTAGANAQGKKTITGTVYDSLNKGLPDVSVHVKNSKTGAVTDAQGNFRIAAGAGDVLQFSSIGYEAQEVAVGNSSNVSVTLKSASNSLNEVVVTGFGSRTNTRKLSYATQEIKATELQTAPSPNVLNSLQGKLAGVRIDQGTGGAGSSSRIRIRGNTSLTGNQSPLFVIDGVLIKPGISGPESWSDNNNVDFGNILKNINEDDIESISVLKGSAASALYGSGAQNGVILITTKKGTGRGLGVSVNITGMWDKAYKTPDFQTEYGGGISPTFEKDADGNNILDPDWSPYYNFGPKIDPNVMVKDLDGHMRPWKNYDFLDFFQTGGQQNYNVALTGATENSSIRASFSKNISTGLIPNGSKLDRNTFTVRGTQKLGKIFNVDVSATYAQSKNTNPTREVSNYNPLFRFTYYRANTTDWNYYLKNYMDTVNGGQVQGAADPYGVNTFLWTTFQNNQYSYDDNLRANIDFTTYIRPWLTLLTRANLNNYDVRIEKKFLGSGAGYANGYYYVQNSQTRNYRFQALLTASRNLTDDLTGSLTLGAEKNKDKLGMVLTQNTNGGLSTNNPFFFNLSNSVNPISTTQSYSPSRLTNAIYAYGDFTWRNMLTLNYSVRQDYNSTLTYADGTGKYTFVYPSVGASFIFTELLKNSSALDFLSYGQLRASYGITGKDYDPFALNQIGNYNLQGADEIVGPDGSVTTIPHAGFTNLTLPNKDFKNEKTKEIEIGANLKFFNNRLGIDVSYYNKNTYNQILALTIPAETGGNNAIFNVGQVRNQGLEILLNATPIQRTNFSWNFIANFSTNKNTIISLAPGIAQYNLLTAFGADVRAIAEPGKQYGAVYSGYSFAYYQATDGDGKPIDDPNNGKKVIGNAPNGSDGLTFLRAQDYGPGLVHDKYLGTIMEKFIAGTYQTFTYKDFTLGFQVDAKVGGLMASGTHQYGGSNGSFTYSLPGRDAAHGGIEYTDDQGVVQHDGIIPDGVFGQGVTANVNGQTIDLAGLTWQEAYESGYVKPKPAWQYYEDLTQWSSGIREYSVFDNSWVALREVAIGYNLPKKISSKLKMNNLRVNLIGRNLTYIWKNAKGGINPEGLSSNNAAAFAEYGGLPYVRSLGFSLNANF